LGKLKGGRMEFMRIIGFRMSRKPIVRSGRGNWASF
jgi:hypothetical protein